MRRSREDTPLLHGNFNYSNFSDCCFFKFIHNIIFNFLDKDASSMMNSSVNESPEDRHFHCNIIVNRGVVTENVDMTHVYTTLPIVGSIPDDL